MRKIMTILLVLDASTSMGSKENEVRDGLMDTLKDTKKIAKKENIDYSAVIVQFSSKVEVIYNGKLNDLDISEVGKNYQASGMTALYDGIGEGMSLIPKEQDGVFINIFTDGQENSSREYKSSDIKRLLKEAKENQWVVTFMGTTEESIDNAVDLGISRGNTMAFHNSGQGVSKMSKTRGSSIMAYTQAVSTNSVTQDSLDNSIKNVLEDEDNS